MRQTLTLLLRKKKCAEAHARMSHVQSSSAIGQSRGGPEVAGGKTERVKGGKRGGKKGGGKEGEKENEEEREKEGRKEEGFSGTLLLDIYSI